MSQLSDFDGPTTPQRASHPFRHPAQPKARSGGGQLFWPLAVVGVLAWFVWQMPTQEQRHAAQYAEHQAHIRGIQAELVRVRADCRADAIEFQVIPSIPSACQALLSAQAQQAAIEVAKIASAMKDLEAQHCPVAAWCPPAAPAGECLVADKIEDGITIPKAINRHIPGCR